MNFSKMNAPLYLASSSPRREELLAQMGLDCEVFPASIDESAIHDEAAVDYVCRMAKEKALEVYSKLAIPNAIVIGGDTCIAFHNQIIGKPVDANDAFQILKRLSATNHEVLSAVSVASNNGVEVALNKTVVTFKELSDQEINQYIDSNEPFGKAGAYAIQGKGAAFIENINGSYSGVMGLPLFELNKLLNQLTSEQKVTNKKVCNDDA